MDEKLRKNLRDYTLNQSNELAHQIVHDLLRTGASEFVPSVDEVGIPNDFNCPSCLHRAHENFEMDEDATRELLDTFGDEETYEIGLYRIHLRCGCEFSKTCQCPVTIFTIEFSTQKCEWCQQTGAVRASGYGYALGPGSPVCNNCYHTLD